MYYIISIFFFQVTFVSWCRALSLCAYKDILRIQQQSKICFTMGSTNSLPEYTKFLDNVLNVGLHHLSGVEEDLSEKLKHKKWVGYSGSKSYCRDAEEE